MVSINTSLSSAVNDYVTSKLSSGSSTSALTSTSLKNYLDETPSDMVRADKIFNNMSIDLGGDGTPITKDQLDSYIKNAKAGTTKISDEQLTALTDLQSNWADISLDGKKISYSDVSIAGYDTSLLSVAPASADNTSLKNIIDLGNEATISAYSGIVKSALGLTSDNNSSAYLSNLKTLLNTLLGGTTDENDDANANSIDTITNVLAAYNKTSTVEIEA